MDRERKKTAGRLMRRSDDPERDRSRAVAQLQYHYSSASFVQEVEGYAPPPEGNTTCTTDIVLSLLLLLLLTISCCFLAR